MDEQPPTPDQPTPPPPYEAGPATSELVTPASRASRARVTALILVILVVLTGGGTALLLRASNSTQSLDHFVPDTAAAYIKFSLHPSLDQQQHIQDLLSRFPASVSKDVGTKLDDALDKALKNLKLSYRNDVKPWVGSQIAIAVLAPTGSSDTGASVPNVIGIVSVRDASAAQKALTKIKNSSPTAPAFLIEGGVAYLGQTQNNIDSFKNAVTSGHTLADNASYKREHDRAGGDGLIFAYADLSKLAGIAPTLRGDILGGSALTGGSGIVAVSLRAESQGIVLSGHSSLPQSPGGAKAGTFKILPTTPDDVLGSVSFFDLGDLVGNLLKTLNKGFGLQPAALKVPVPGVPQVADALKGIEQALGLNLQKDLLPWLKGELSIVIGPVTNPPIPDIGILIEPTDRAALGRTLNALRTHLGALLGSKGKVVTNANGLTIKTSIGEDVVVHVTSDRVIIASSPQYAQRLLNPSGSSLGNDTVYKATVDPTKPTVFQLFVRLDRVRTLVEGLLKLSNPNGYSDYERNVQPYVTPLQALGIQSSISGSDQDFRLVLTIAKP
ncbi:MAG TPA: DUF3352 domain-containing protein [Actinomycetota bacterium]|nr:DUF3352 domain-containing protein [Actinomycetota bacterium]